MSAGGETAGQPAGSCKRPKGGSCLVAPRPGRAPTRCRARGRCFARARVGLTRFENAEATGSACGRSVSQRWPTSRTRRSFSARSAAARGPRRRERDPGGAAPASADGSAGGTGCAPRRSARPERLAGRLLHEVGERDELWSLLLAHLWERIRSYPLEKRPRRIAANLLLDTAHATLAELRRERRLRASFLTSPRRTLPPRRRWSRRRWCWRVRCGPGRSPAGRRC